MNKMKKGLKIFKVEFEPLWPVGNCLIIAASNLEEATTLAKQTIHHTQDIEIIEMVVDKPQVIVYLSGDY